MATTAAVGAKEGPRWGEKKREKKKKERKEWSLVLNDKKKSGSRRNLFLREVVDGGGTDCEFLHSFIHSFIHSSVCSFIDSFICLFIHSLFYCLFFCSFAAILSLHFVCFVFFCSYYAK